MVREVFTELPSSNEIFIDSNVLFLVHTQLPTDSQHRDKQSAYSNAIAFLIKNNKKLVTSWLNIAEVFNTIERVIFDTYKSASGVGERFSKKDFRNLLDQRELVYNEIMRVYNEIELYYFIADATFKKNAIDKFARTYLQHKYDPSDFIMATIIIRDEIKDVISDDKDFHDETRFTSHSRV